MINRSFNHPYLGVEIIEGLLIYVVVSCNIHLKNQIFHLLLYFFVSANGVIDDSDVSNKCGYKLWHFLRNGCCFCGITEHGVIECDEHFISVKQGSCVTYDNATDTCRNSSLLIHQVE